MPIDYVHPNMGRRPLSMNGSWSSSRNSDSYRADFNEGSNRMLGKWLVASFIMSLFIIWLIFYLPPPPKTPTFAHHEVEERCPPVNKVSYNKEFIDERISRSVNAKINEMFKAVGDGSRNV